MLGRIAAVLLLSTVAVTATLAQGNDLVFAVTEGVTYQATPKEIRDKFTPLAEVIGKAVGRHVKIVLVPAYNDVRAGMAKQEYDIAYIHPAHVSMAEIKAGRYRAVAWTTGFTEYTVSLMIKSDAQLKTMDDLKGRTLVTPDPDSITAVMVRAMFRGEKPVETRLAPQWSLDRIARLMKDDRDANFVATNKDGVTVNRWTSTGFLAASATTNETAFLTYKVVRSSGMLVFDNQARV